METMDNNYTSKEVEKTGSQYELQKPTVSDQGPKLISPRQRKNYSKAAPNTIQVDEGGMYKLILEVARIKNHAWVIALLSIIITLCGSVVASYIINPSSVSLDPFIIAACVVGFVGGTVISSLLGKVKNKKEIESILCDFYKGWKEEYAGDRIVFNENGNIDFKNTKRRYDERQKSNSNGIWKRLRKSSPIIALPLMLLIPYQVVARPSILSNAFSVDKIDVIGLLFGITSLALTIICFILIEKMQRQRAELIELIKRSDEKKDPERLYRRAAFYLKSNRTEAALNLISEAISLNPNSIRYYELRADILLKSGEADRAIEDYLWVLNNIKKNTEKLRLTRIIANAFYDSKNTNKAVEYYEKAIAIIKRLKSTEKAPDYKEIINTLNDYGV